MAIPVYNTGTASVAANGTAVSNGGTGIWSNGNVKEGDWIVIDGAAMTMVLAVVDSEHVTIAEWKGGAKTNVTYAIYQNYSARDDSVAIAKDVGTLVAALNKEGFFWFVAVDESAPDPSRGDDGQFAYQPTTGKQWHKVGGAWVYDGIFKGLRFRGVWSSVTNYVVNDVVNDNNGTSYVAIADNINKSPPSFSAIWNVLAGKGGTGATGPAAWLPPVAWVTATAYTVGPPASVVIQGGETYVCLVSHTAGTFATDLAANRWIKVAQKGGGDVTAANNGSEFANKATTINNLTGVSFGSSQSLNSAQRLQARVNIDAASTAKTRTIVTSGSGTYTTPANCKSLLIRGKGGGGGGGGGGYSGGSSGGNGGNSTFGTLTANGGAGGSPQGAYSNGGGASNGDVNIQGGGGEFGEGAGIGAVANAQGGRGGGSAAGSGGFAGAAGQGAGTGSGCGGGGGGGIAGSGFGGAGGAEGGYFEKLIVGPAATYSYAVGAAGSGGNLAGPGGGNGGGGSSGWLIIDEYY